MKTFLSLLCLLAFSSMPGARAEEAMTLIDRQLAAHPGQTGVYVLDTGEEALLARAWLADHARQTIEVQYFIWSADNIGILAAEALLRAAERGVKVRILVDDLMIDAPDKSLLALALHPNIDIRIYNPQSSVGVPVQKRVLNVATDFRGINQRMHDKTFIVDSKIAITGGRNMADEYFDYNHEYNFRDRDALILGQTAQAMRDSFELFWDNELSAPVESLYDGIGLMQKNVKVGDDEVAAVYRELHGYADNPQNFAPEVRAAIEAVPTSFAALTRQMVWGQVEFISDTPGKNDNRFRLGGGGMTTAALAKLVDSAQQSITIQSPYLVLSDEAIELFRNAIARGVKIRINTNSLASSDNLQASSGYRNQRAALLKMGMNIYEYRPDPAVRKKLLKSAISDKIAPPIFALHAKTMVVDSCIAFIGTFNLDPRSENLNTEVGVIVRDATLARAVESAIETDMQPENSWNAATDDPDRHVSFFKRSRVRFWQLLPIKPLL
ncbi:MAG: phospholipase D family protein [Gammaproteobacteria bacterium]|nr:phospholipase D family protein [Gammaproteobacteria bacterium]MBU1776769.1 phospholipase D family protein [Gammaproteobacteria bacterium]MBU1968947.1 phospholipase D family protein [Gammaproteobacteria bacterium]